LIGVFRLHAATGEAIERIGRAMTERRDSLEWLLKALELEGGAAGPPAAGDCPSDERFAAFLDGLLQGEEAADLREHLVRCPLCHLGLRAWTEASAGEGPPVPAAALERARALVKPGALKIALRLLGRFFEILNPSEIPLSTVPATAPVLRSGGAGAAASPRHEVVDLKPSAECLESIRLQSLEDTGRLKVTVFPAPDVALDPPGRLRVELFQEDACLQSWPLRAGGPPLHPLDPGLYRLEVREVVLEEGHPKLHTRAALDLDLT